MNEQASQPWKYLIGRLNTWRKNRPAHTKELAALRKGANALTEHYAYPYVLPYVKDMSKQEQTAFLRVAAMLAEHPNIPVYVPTENEKKYRLFGEWCYQLTCALSDKKGKAQPVATDSDDFVGQRLAYLHTQDLEEAALSIRRLLSMADSLKAPPALDTYSLARLLRYWGNGLSPASQENRQRILRDYYSAFLPYMNDTAPKTPETHE